MAAVLWGLDFFCKYIVAYDFYRLTIQFLESSGHWFVYGLLNALNLAIQTRASTF